MNLQDRIRGEFIGHTGSRIDSTQGVYMPEKGEVGQFKNELEAHGFAHVLIHPVWGNLSLDCVPVIFRPSQRFTKQGVPYAVDLGMDAQRMNSLKRGSDVVALIYDAFRSLLRQLPPIGYDLGRPRLSGSSLEVPIAEQVDMSLVLEDFESGLERLATRFRIHPDIQFRISGNSIVLSPQPGNSAISIPYAFLRAYRDHLEAFSKGF